jgi:hypothetical protein
MVGQLANFMKSFGLIKDILIEPVWRDLATAASVGYNIYNLGRQFDEQTSSKDKAQAAANIATAALSGVPVIGPVIGAVPTIAGYITDVVEGKTNGPPALEPGVEKNNQIGNIAHNVVNSNPFKTFFSNFGNWTLK